MFGQQVETVGYVARLWEKVEPELKDELDTVSIETFTYHFDFHCIQKVPPNIVQNIVLEI